MMANKEENMENENGKCNHTHNASLVGPVWYIGWLFTVAFVHLPFWKALLALIIWPYYLGSALG
jgi:hypothetical protein